MKNSVPYIVEEITSGDTVTTYIGYANGNPVTSEAKFAIMRIVEVTVSTTITTTIMFPNGSINFKYIWDDRASDLTYNPYSNQ